MGRSGLCLMNDLFPSVKALAFVSFVYLVLGYFLFVREVSFFVCKQGYFLVLPESIDSASCRKEKALYMHFLKKRNSAPRD
jgi:hypothetical protein